MSLRLHPVLVAASVAAVLAGLALLGGAWWLQPLAAADRAAASGDRSAALDAYRAASARLARVEVAGRLLAREHGDAVFNQLALLYRDGAYDAVMAAAVAAPPQAAPQFWSGTARLARALREPDPQSRLAWLTAAESDLKQAVQAAPEDWDARYNFELAARLAADLRRQTGRKPDSRMQLLRPQPPQQPQTPRKVG